MWAHNALTEFGETAIAVQVGNCRPAISRKFVLHDTWHFRNATFYFWCRSLRSEMSWPWAVLAGLSYFCMVSTWGGYVFVVNVVVTWPWLQAMFVGFQVHPRTFCIQTRLTTCRIITWIWSGENVKLLVAERCLSRPAMLFAWCCGDTPANFTVPRFAVAFGCFLGVVSLGTERNTRAGSRGQSGHFVIPGNWWYIIRLTCTWGEINDYKCLDIYIHMCMLLYCLLSYASAWQCMGTFISAYLSYMTVYDM